MKQPVFAWWPYRVLSLAVPAFAILAALLVGSSSPRRHDLQWFRDWFSILASILGAGNGYLLGIACGDLKRTILATCIGVGAGALAVAILVHSLAALLFALLLLCSMLIGLRAQPAPRIAGGCAVIALMLTIFSVGMALSQRSEHIEFVVVFFFPFVCGFSGLAAVERMTPRCILTAISNALNAGVLAMCFIVPILFIAIFVLILNDSEGGMLFLCSLCLPTLNYFFVREIFTTLHRVEPLASPEILSKPDSTDGAAH